MNLSRLLFLFVFRVGATLPPIINPRERAGAMRGKTVFSPTLKRIDESPQQQDVESPVSDLFSDSDDDDEDFELLWSLADSKQPMSIVSLIRPRANLPPLISIPGRSADRITELLKLPAKRNTFLPAIQESGEIQ